MPILMSKLALVGLVQGAALAVLQTIYAQGHWPANGAPMLLALLYAGVALPLAWYLTEAIPGLAPRRRRSTVVSLGIVLILLGAYEGWAGADPSGGPQVGPTTFACLALGFIGVPLLAHASPHGGRTWRWDYAALFQTTWRNGMLLIVATTLTGIL
jgi:hypothetical protein